MVGATTSEQDALNCLKANDVQLLVCTDLLEHSSGPGLVAAAKAPHPQLRCLMLTKRALHSTIDAAIVSGCEGLCSRERLGDGWVLSVLQAMDSDGIHDERRTVNNSPGIEDLIKRYIKERGTVRRS